MENRMIGPTSHYPTLGARRINHLAYTFCLIVLFVPNIALSQSGLSVARPMAPYLNNMFPSTTPGGDIATGDWTQRNYFPGISFVEPLRIVEHPTQNKIIVVGKDGKGHSITNIEGSKDKTEFFNIQPIMFGSPGGGEGGMSDIVFHPEFDDPSSPNSRYVYISYYWSPINSGTFAKDNGINGYNRVSRFEVLADKVDLSTELVMINQYDREHWHIGMDMEFGADGFLYIAAADETPTTCCDKNDTTQRIDAGLFSGILRIDVDNDPIRSHSIRRQPVHPVIDPTTLGSEWPASYTQGYSIPNSNPFLAADGSQLEEFFSIGLRHPWTMSFDEQTGNLWVADVGGRKQEEINIVSIGDNHQWPYREGMVAGPEEPPAQIIGTPKGPVYDYRTNPDNAVIGAGVYRGQRYPELIGKYLFSDFMTGELWTATENMDGYSVEQIGDVTISWHHGISSYLMDSKGQILLARNGGPLAADGRVDVLVKDGESVMVPEPPALLSSTGAFSDLANMTVVDGCIPYELNVPFWSDGALKSRWVCVPNDGSHDSAGEKIGFSEQGIWQYPQGTVLIKHFEMLANQDDLGSAYPLETRFMVNGEDGFYGVTYQWDTAGNDATLVSSSGAVRNYSQLTEAGLENFIWEFPSRAECLECHTDVAGGALGLNARQLNREQSYPTNITANQLETFNHLNMFSPSLDVSQIPNYLTSAPSDDLSKSLEDRARSYLDSNCSYCHMPDGVRAGIDARLTTPLAEQGLIEGNLLESYDITGEKVIVPGNLTKSILHHRLTRTDDLSMPPVGKNRTDENGVKLIESWILSMGTGPDSDNDGVPDNQDVFPNDPTETSDKDEDGTGDNSDPYPLDAANDFDGDGISGHIDNCPDDANADQADADTDGQGDVCDNQTTGTDFTTQLMEIRFGGCIGFVESDTEGDANMEAVNAASVACEDGLASQVFVFTLIDGFTDRYTIQPSQNEQCMTVANGARENTANITFSACSGVSYQQFRLQADGDNYIIYTGTGTGEKVLDANAQSGNIEQWGDLGNGNQRWSLNKTFIPGSGGGASTDAGSSTGIGSTVDDGSNTDVGNAPGRASSSGLSGLWELLVIAFAVGIRRAKRMAVISE